MTYARLPNGDVRLDFSAAPSIILSLYQGGVVRVRWLPTGAPHPHMRRTWSFVDKYGNCPPEGWQRDSLSEVIADRFPRLTPTLNENEGRLRLAI